MRTKLQSIEKQRLRFRAHVARLGSRTNYLGYREETILMQQIERVDSGELVTDHVWFTMGKTLDKLRPALGDVLEFDARVVAYTKG